MASQSDHGCSRPEVFVTKVVCSEARVAAPATCCRRRWRSKRESCRDSTGWVERGKSMERPRPRSRRESHGLRSAPNKWWRRLFIGKSRHHHLFANGTSEEYKWVWLLYQLLGLCYLPKGVEERGKEWRNLSGVCQDLPVQLGQQEVIGKRAQATPSSPTRPAKSTSTQTAPSPASDHQIAVYPDVYKKYLLPKPP